MQDTVNQGYSLADLDSLVSYSIVAFKTLPLIFSPFKPLSTFYPPICVFSLVDCFILPPSPVQQTSDLIGNRDF